MLNKDKFKMDLQLFGDDAGVDNPIDEPQDNPEPKTYTKEELELEKQKEADKRVSEALKTAEKKWKNELEEKMRKEREEAKRLADLTAEEREKELQAEKEKEIEKTQARLNKQLLEIDTRDALAEAGLSIKFTDYVIRNDIDSTSESIKAFKELFNSEKEKAVEAEVNERLKGKTPKVGGDLGNKGKNPWSKEHFNLTEQGKIIRENPELAVELQAAAQ